MAVGPAAAVGTSRKLIPGQTLGRYVVIAKLGAGGMGAVYSAYDRDLDRKVALKVMHHMSEDARLRLRREGKSLARLSHPNVVSIYELLRHEGLDVVVMQYVRGSNLTEWLESRPRSVKEIVSVFRRAGEGLLAAHRAGLVHRDFKPDNVLIDGPEQAYVTDFGVAKEVGTIRATTGPVAEDDSPTLTVAGAIIGTPAYMAPEQLRGDPCDARCDQFAFCASLYEALHDELPFVGESFGELRDNVLSGARRPIPKGSRAPAWLQRVLDRGLAGRPGDRFESMEELLEALSNRRRRRVVKVVAAAASMTLIFGFGGVVAAGGDSPEMCKRASSRMERVWNDEARRRMQRSFEDSSSPLAGDAFVRTDLALTSYGESWLDERQAACRATRVDGEQSEALLDLRMLCLDRRLDAMSGLVSALTAKADASTVEDAQSLVYRLPAVDDCSDLKALSTTSPLPADGELREKIRHLEVELEGLRTQHLTLGRYSEGVPVVTEFIARAATTNYEPLVARSQHVLGLLYLKLSQGERAEKALFEALEAASRSGDFQLAAQVWGDLIFVVGYQLERFAEADILGKTAERTLSSRLGRSARGDLIMARGALHYGRGQYKSALSHYRRALELLSASFGESHPRTTRALNNVGAMLQMLSRDQEALEVHRRVLQIREEVFGPRHPKTAITLENVGATLATLGNYPEAIEAVERAEKIYESAKLQVRQATCLRILGDIRSRVGQFSRAERDLLGAIELVEAARGPTGSDVASNYGFLGDHYLRAGRYRDAASAYDHAIAVSTDTLGAEHPRQASRLAHRGEAELHLGRVERALASFEQALAIRLTHAADISPQRIAASKFDVARALHRARRDPRRARRLAKEALAVFVAEGVEDKASEVEAFLRLR